MNLKEFKNGNIHLKMNKEERKYNKSEAFQELIETLDMHDMYIACEAPYCVSNYCTAIDFYCIHNSLCYTIKDFEFNDLMNLKTIILKSWKPSKEEKKKFLIF